MAQQQLADHFAQRRPPGLASEDDVESSFDQEIAQPQRLPRLAATLRPFDADERPAAGAWLRAGHGAECSRRPPCRRQPPGYRPWRACADPALIRRTANCEFINERRAAWV